MRNTARVPLAATGNARTREAATGMAAAIGNTGNAACAGSGDAAETTGSTAASGSGDAAETTAGGATGTAGIVQSGNARRGESAAR
jgi:hypothetical protein